MVLSSIFWLDNARSPILWFSGKDSQVTKMLTYDSEKNEMSETGLQPRSKFNVNLLKTILPGESQKLIECYINQPFLKCLLLV